MLGCLESNLQGTPLPPTQREHLGAWRSPGEVLRSLGGAWGSAWEALGDPGKPHCTYITDLGGRGKLIIYVIYVSGRAWEAPNVRKFH